MVEKIGCLKANCLRLSLVGRHGLDTLNGNFSKNEILVLRAGKVLFKHGDVIPKDGFLNCITCNLSFSYDTAIAHLSIHKAKFNLRILLNLRNAPRTP